MPKFYMIFARKIFFPIFFFWGEEQVPPAPVSYAYAYNSFFFVVCYHYLVNKSSYNYNE